MRSKSTLAPLLLLAQILAYTNGAFAPPPLPNLVHLEANFMNYCGAAYYYSVIVERTLSDAMGTPWTEAACMNRLRPLLGKRLSIDSNLRPFYIETVVVTRTTDVNILLLDPVDWRQVRRIRGKKTLAVLNAYSSFLAKNLQSLEIALPFMVAASNPFGQHLRSLVRLTELSIAVSPSAAPPRAFSSANVCGIIALHARQLQSIVLQLERLDFVAFRECLVSLLRHLEKLETVQAEWNLGNEPHQYSQWTNVWLPELQASLRQTPWFQKNQVESVLCSYAHGGLRLKLQKKPQQQQKPSVLIIDDVESFRLQQERQGWRAMDWSHVETIGGAGAFSTLLQSSDVLPSVQTLDLLPAKDLSFPGRVWELGLVLDRLPNLRKLSLQRNWIGGWRILSLEDSLVQHAPNLEALLIQVYQPTPDYFHRVMDLFFPMSTLRHIDLAVAKLPESTVPGNHWMQERYFELRNSPRVAEVEWKQTQDGVGVFRILLAPLNIRDTSSAFLSASNGMNLDTISRHSSFESTTTTAMHHTFKDSEQGSEKDIWERLMCGEINLDLDP